MFHSLFTRGIAPDDNNFRDMVTNVEGSGKHE